MTIKNYSVVEAKKHFSEILARVAYGGERVLISKRGKALAMIIPSAEKPEEDHISKVQGWLDEADPFFNLMDQIVREREKHAPRISRQRRN
jgi:prevent-host-death family protein